MTAEHYETMDATYAVAFVERAEACGAPRARVLTGTGITEADLDQPDRRLPRTAVHLVWRRAIRLSGDPDFGLHVGERLRPPMLRVLGPVVANCSTLGEAIEHYVGYERLQNDAHTISFVRGPHRRGILRYRPSPTGAEPHQAEAVFSAIVTAGRWMLGPELAPAAVRFSGAAPATGADEYRRIFRCPVTFGGSGDEIEFSAVQLAQPMPFADPDLLELNGAYADRLVAALPGVGRLTDYVRRRLRDDLAGADQRAVAASVNLSVRTFQRELRAQGTSWQALLDEARHARATERLSPGRAAGGHPRRIPTLAELAAELGYSEPSAFVRAFRRWEGTTPGGYAANRADGPH